MPPKNREFEVMRDADVEETLRWLREVERANEAEEDYDE